MGSDFHGRLHSLTNSREQSSIYSLGKDSSVQFCKVPFTNSTSLDSNRWCQPKPRSLAGKGERLHKEELSLRIYRCFLARLPHYGEIRTQNDRQSLETVFQKYKFRLDIFSDAIQEVNEMWPKQDGIISVPELYHYKAI